MKFTVIILPSAAADLTYFRTHEQRIILTGIATHLTYDATSETKRRKKRDPNRIAPWELRIDHYRIFYDIEQTTRLSSSRSATKSITSSTFVERRSTYDNT